MSIEDAAWVSAFGTILVSVVAIILALYREKITAYWKSPKLVVELNPCPPDSHKTIVRAMALESELEGGCLPSAIRELAPRQSNIPPPDSQVWPAFFWRMRIWNKGTSGAENVEVIVVNVERKVGNAFKKVEEFPPENLVWSTYFEYGGQTAVFMPTLSPDTYKFCNLGYALPPEVIPIINPDIRPFVKSNQVVFQFQVKFQSNLGYFQLVPGIYRFTIWAAASNAKRVEKHYQMEVDGDWTDNENVMLTQRVKITEI